MPVTVLGYATSLGHKRVATGEIRRQVAQGLDPTRSRAFVIWKADGRGFRRTARGGRWAYLPPLDATSTWTPLAHQLGVRAAHTLLSLCFSACSPPRWAPTLLADRLSAAVVCACLLPRCAASPRRRCGGDQTGQPRSEAKPVGELRRAHRVWNVEIEAPSTRCVDVRQGEDRVGRPPRGLADGLHRGAIRIRAEAIGREERVVDLGVRLRAQRLRGGVRTLRWRSLAPVRGMMRGRGRGCRSNRQAAAVVSRARTASFYCLTPKSLTASRGQQTAFAIRLCPIAEGRRQSDALVDADAGGDHPRVLHSVDLAVGGPVAPTPRRHSRLAWHPHARSAQAGIIRP